MLLLNTDLDIGGTPTVVRELALRLRPWMEVDVASLKSIGPIGEQLQKENVNVTAFDARSVSDVMRVRRELIQLIRSRGYQTVFSFLVHGNMLAWLARRKCPGVSKWIQSIQTTQPNPRWHWTIQRIASRSAEVMIVPSESIARIARERCNLSGRIVIIPNAIDVERFTSARHVVFSGPTIQIAFVGRLDPIKRIDDLIEAIGLLPDSFRLNIWGEGSERTRLETMVESKRMSDRITFHGATTDLVSAYQLADLLVLPSDAEGFGLVLIEAMASGVPVIATNAPGIRDVVRDQQTGLLVGPRDPVALARAIQSLATDPVIRERIIRNGLTHVGQNYSWDRIIESYRSILI